MLMLDIDCSWLINGHYEPDDNGSGCTVILTLLLSLVYVVIKIMLWVSMVKVSIKLFSSDYDWMLVSGKYYFVYGISIKSSKSGLVIKVQVPHMNMCSSRCHLQCKLV